MNNRIKLFLPKVQVEGLVIHYRSPDSHLNYLTLCGIGKRLSHTDTKQEVGCARCLEIAEHVRKHAYYLET